MTREILIDGINKLIERGEFEKYKDSKSFSIKDEKGNYAQVSFEMNGDELTCTTGKLFKKRFVVKMSELKLKK